MNSPHKPVEASVQELKPAPVAVFKNSLRAWQARYQARRSSAPTRQPNLGEPAAQGNNSPSLR
jgi:hypothetical protein